MQRAEEESGIFASEDKTGLSVGFFATVLGRNLKGCVCFLEVLCSRIYPMSKFFCLHSEQDKQMKKS